jgi:hypothetical protein
MICIDSSFWLAHSTASIKGRTFFVIGRVHHVNTAVVAVGIALGKDAAMTGMMSNM